MPSLNAPVSITLNAVIFDEGEKWIAQGLEYDICAQGNSIAEATNAFQIAVVSNLVESIRRSGEAFGGIGAAPKKFWEMFETSRVSIAREPGPLRAPEAVPLPAIQQGFRLVERVAA